MGSGGEEDDRGMSVVASDLCGRVVYWTTGKLAYDGRRVVVES